ncbi:MAG: hypothetical protein EBW06_11450 [Gammaproteobacteria bacterium]|nr:hypothetical protein [Gammaproteobacteria bacterium]
MRRSGWWRSVVRLCWRSYRLWDREDCVDLSAAFAYHTLQSIFPILLIALGVASRVLGSADNVSDQLLELADQVLPASVIPVIVTPSSNFSKAIRKVTVSSSVTTGADTVPTNPISPSPPLYMREISSGERASSYIRRSSICPAKY